MEKFLLITEHAVYRRRYVIKKPPTEKGDLSTLVALGVELPEGFVLEGSLKDIKYETEEITVESSDIVLKQAMQKLTSLEDWEPKEIKTKIKRKEPKQAERGNTEETVSEVPTVKAKVKRSKSIDWGELKNKLDSTDENTMST